MPAGSTSRSRRTPDAGFVLDVRSLGRAPGTMRELHRTVTIEERIGLDLIGVPSGSEVDLDLQLQSVSEGVLVTGTVSAPLSGECSRCLEPLTDRAELRLTELFAYPASTTERTTSEDEVYRMSDDLIDLKPVVVDALGIELPLQPLCSPDCQGLCSECGMAMADVGPEHEHETIDPRWAGLANFATGSTGSGSPEQGAATEESSADMASNKIEEK